MIQKLLLCKKQKKETGDKMYDIGQNYLLLTKEGTFYTCKIIEESETHIRINTIKDEDFILEKNEIKKGKKIYDINFKGGNE